MMTPSGLRYSVPFDREAVEALRGVEHHHPYDRHQKHTTTNSLSTMQAERVRIAADMRLRHEVRRRDADIRRLLTHVNVLESLQEMQRIPADSPPHYIDSIETSEDADTACIEVAATLQYTDKPELELEDNDDDFSSSSDADSDGWSEDDSWSESDDDEEVQDVLKQLSLLSAVCFRDLEQGGPPIKSGNYDSWHASEVGWGPAGISGCDPVISTSCVEVTELDE